MVNREWLLKRQTKNFLNSLIQLSSLFGLRALKEIHHRILPQGSSPVLRLPAAQSRKARAGNVPESVQKAMRPGLKTRNRLTARLSRKQELTDKCLKFYRPIERINEVSTPCVSVQVVDDVAAADDQNALIAQRCEPFC